MDQVIGLLRSKLKIEILNTLSSKSLTPLMISKILKRPRPSISRAILDLNKLGYVKCLNPEKDRWRKYKITKKGKEILKKIKIYQ